MTYKTSERIRPWNIYSNYWPKNQCTLSNLNWTLVTPNCTNPNTEFLPQYLARVIVGYTLFFIAIVGNVLTLIPLVANIKRMPIYRKEVILYESYNMTHIQKVVLDQRYYNVDFIIGFLAVKNRNLSALQSFNSIQ